MLKICKTHSSSLSLSRSNTHTHTHTHTLACTYVHVDLWPFCCVSDTISGGFISWAAGSAASWTHKLFRLQSTLMLPPLSQIATETIILNPNTGLPRCLPYLPPHPRSITTLPAFLLHSRANSEPGIVKHIFFFSEWSMKAWISITGLAVLICTITHKSHITHTPNVLLYTYIILSYYPSTTFFFCFLCKC